MEAAVLISAVSLAVVASGPLFYRHLRGGHFFSTAQSLDRQFDPYDANAGYELAHNDSASTTTTTRVGFEREQLLSASKSQPLIVDVGMSMGFTTMPRGPMPGEGMTESSASVSSGNSWEDYEYDDRIQPLVP